MVDNPKTAPPRIFSLDEIEHAIRQSPTFAMDLIDATEQGFIDYSHGKFNAAPIQTLGAPPLAPFSTTGDSYGAQTCIKSGYVTDAEHYVVKVAAGGYPMPANTGNLQVYSQATGRLEYLLLDEGILTEHRTAAAGAVVARRILGSSSSSISMIGILGTGIQARYQLEYLQHITPCRTVMVWGRTPEHVLTYKSEMEAKGWALQIANDPSELLVHCNLIVTVTSGREPILRRQMEQHLKPGRQLITCIGADAPGKQELDLSLVKEADLLLADALVQTSARGEFHRAIQEKAIALDNVVELGTFLSSPLNDDSHESLTIFDSSGVAFQDYAVASLVGSLLSDH